MGQSTETDQSAQFQAEVQHVRASGALGRGTQMQRLFEFLVACQETGRVPKELEVAVDCFERSAVADLAQDSTVRVTAHKLRRRLHELYQAHGGPHRLIIPRGEYRLCLEAAGPDLAGGTPAGWRRLLPATRRERIGVAVFLLLMLAAISITMAIRGTPGPSGEVAALRRSLLWAPLLADDVPVQLVLGDYYIFGERDAGGQIRRLVRDFDINSRKELEEGFIADPSLAGRYADLGLGYLPTSSAQALREVLPVLMASGKQVSLTLASELDASTIKSTHIVYVGYLSALGMLEEIVFAGSRYVFGSSYDELIDSQSGEIWVSEAGEVQGAADRYRDYAYLGSMRGPGGLAHLIIAGTRDTGLMQAAEASADPRAVAQLADKVPGLAAFEALYEVDSVNGINVESRLLQASPLMP